MGKGGVSGSTGADTGTLSDGGRSTILVSKTFFVAAGAGTLGAGAVGKTGTGIRVTLTGLFCGGASAVLVTGLTGVPLAWGLVTTDAFARVSDFAALGFEGRLSAMLADGDVVGYYHVK